MIMVQDKEELTKFFLFPVITFSCILYLLSRSTLKQLLLKFSGYPLLLKKCINLTNSKWNLVRYE